MSDLAEALHGLGLCMNYGRPQDDAVGHAMWDDAREIFERLLEQEIKRAPDNGGERHG